MAAGVGFEATGERQEYPRVRVQRDENRVASLIPCHNQSSGVGTSLSSADGLAIIPPFTSVNEGDMLTFIPFKELVY